MEKDKTTDLAAPATENTALQILDQAKNKLAKAGALLRGQEIGADQDGLARELADLMVVDSNIVVPITRLLKAAPAFNEVVRNNVDAMEVGDRYRKIAADFDSIRKDAERLVVQLDDGKIDLTEKLANVWMKTTRGTIADRFNAIRETAEKVFRDSDDQVARATAILQAYSDFRLGMKQAVVLSKKLLKETQVRLDDAKQALDDAQATVDKPSGDAEQEARHELERDRRLAAYQAEDRRYQKAKNLEENLSNSHNVSDVVMARLNQTLQVHEQVLSQARTFMATNETVLTALSASFTSSRALHESASALDAMRAGVNDALESQATIGTQVQEQALRSALGPGIKAESVKHLVDAIVSFQERSIALTDELRKQSSKASEDIAEEVESGRRRLVALATHPAQQVTEDNA